MQKKIIEIFIILSAIFLIFVSETPAKQNTLNAIKYIVNNQPITTYDIERRKAFLKISGIKSQAEEEMITQAIKLSEMQKMNIVVTNDQINYAYASFAQSNNMTPQKFDEVLLQSGVTARHFKEHMRAQIGWNQVIKKINQQKGSETPSGILSKKQKRSSKKPTAKEYILQSISFIIPKDNQNKTQIITQRKKEAQEVRKKFTDCKNTHSHLNGIIDVTVHNIGRFLDFSLPYGWEKEILSIQKAGHTTPIRQTDMGVEFIAVCQIKTVSDDRVENILKLKEEKSDIKINTEALNYLKELQKKAKIIKL